MWTYRAKHIKKTVTLLTWTDQIPAYGRKTSVRMDRHWNPRTRDKVEKKFDNQQGYVEKSIRKNTVLHPQQKKKKGVDMKGKFGRVWETFCTKAESISKLIV